MASETNIIVCKRALHIVRSLSFNASEGRAKISPQDLSFVYSLSVYFTVDLRKELLTLHETRLRGPTRTPRGATPAPRRATTVTAAVLSSTRLQYMARIGLYRKEGLPKAAAVFPFDMLNFSQQRIFRSSAASSLAPGQPTPSCQTPARSGGRTSAPGTTFHWTPLSAGVATLEFRVYTWPHLPATNFFIASRRATDNVTPRDFLRLLGLQQRGAR